MLRDKSRINGGVNLSRTRTKYYSEVKDLLGGRYWLDVDKFAERDMGVLNPVPYQNDMYYYLKHGHARAAQVGDKVGYNYYGNILRYNVWGQYGFNIGGVNIGLGAEIGNATIWRHGLWQKGLFLDNSKGDSKKQHYLEYTFKGNFEYRINAAQSLEASIAYIQAAPQFQAAFISPRTRNSATPGVSAEKILSVDASYNLRLGDARFKLSGYFTEIKDQSRVLSYYDDVEATFSNFAMSGIDKRYFGLEFAATVPLFAGISFNGAASWGQYTYNSNPDYVQIQDNSGVVQNEGRVYWKNYRIESTPQTAVNLGLSYRGPNNLFASIDVNYYNNMYISMSPVYRTDEVLSLHMTDEEMSAIRDQENFGGAWVWNASVGKNWYINRKYTLVLALMLKTYLTTKTSKLVDTSRYVC